MAYMLNFTPCQQTMYKLGVQYIRSHIRKDTARSGTKKVSRNSEITTLNKILHVYPADIVPSDLPLAVHICLINYIENRRWSMLSPRAAVPKAHFKVVARVAVPKAHFMVARID